ncbi:ABC transporter ATP-binding protein [Gracilibacillus kekensis]|uniref:Energy-coupling factor transport system ATP-binding protein n=1 Tax=Gracilibacillus kekensis TaxID=1027249 RepID=A0A1M7PMB0_9BACI|nr:ABC transporter ATP-binding protein [Gracilibacillus kekensis]SHN18405.1 energy-coupling factor transport system ATP-binding protein [Gracilibacillus kekensis]
MLEIEKLRVIFPDRKNFIFKDLSLSIPSGQKVLIVGPSGSGKSTLLQILAGLIPSVIEVPLKADRLQVDSNYGMVFQDPDSQFCMPYVDEEIAFVLENRQVPSREMKEKIQRILARVDLQLEDIHTPINQLSGGMKQRLAIACALALQPDVLFLDEPTALLDAEGTKQVWDTIKSIQDEQTIVIIEHKIEFVSDIVDRVIMLDDQGELVADGSPTRVFQDHKQMFDQFGIWHPSSWSDYLVSRTPQHKGNDRTAHTLIELDSASGYYHKNREILVDKAVINKGDWIAITGPNGSGKSTLVQMIMQLINTKGSIHYFFAEQNLPIYQKIAFVFQNPELQFVTNSVYQELAFSLTSKDTDKKAKIKEHLKRYRLEQVNDHHPYQLSVGQKRRLSVATATIKVDDIIILDEPTFGQDAINTFMMLDCLEELRQKGITIVMVTHDQQIVDHFATKEWKIDQGQLVEEKYHDLFQSEKVGVSSHAL